MSNKTIDYEKFEVNGRIFRVGGPALVGTGNRAECTITRIYAFKDTNKPYPFVEVSHPGREDKGDYVPMRFLNELVHVGDPIPPPYQPTSPRPAGWATVRLATDEKGRIDFSKFVLE